MTLINSALFLDAKEGLIAGTGFPHFPGDFLDRGCWAQEHRCPLESHTVQPARRAGCLLYQIAMTSGHSELLFLNKSPHGEYQEVFRLGQVKAALQMGFPKNHQQLK